MPLSRTFKSTIKDRAQKDSRFRAALLSEGIETLLAGDIDTAKSLLRDYINATVGFEDLARRTGTPPKSLMRMFGPRGNPSARNLSAVLSHLQRNSGVSLRVRPAGQGRGKAV
jgi:DNA-binding phage protein